MTLRPLGDRDIQFDGFESLWQGRGLRHCGVIHAQCIARNQLEPALISPSDACRRFTRFGCRAIPVPTFGTPEVIEKRVTAHGDDLVKMDEGGNVAVDTS
jgi:hypothetical protein